MPTAPVNGTTVHFEVTGEGPVCLVLHGGLGLDSSYLQAGLGPLARRLRLVFYDQRGNGRSGRPELDTLTMAQLADDADALAAHLGAGRVLVLGHAFGGFVAQELALRHPGRVEGLVLVATTPGQLGARESLLDDQGPPLPPEVEFLVRIPPATDEELAATYRELLRHHVRSGDPEEAREAFAATRFDAAAMARSLQLVGEWTAVDRLSAVRAPALVIAGRHDVFSPPEQAARLARRLPRAEVVVLEDSAHLPWLDEPERFFAVVENWLDRFVPA